MKIQDCRTTDLKKKKKKKIRCNTSGAPVFVAAAQGTTPDHLALAASRVYIHTSPRTTALLLTAAWKGLDLYDMLTPKAASGVRKTLPESPPPPPSQQYAASVERTTAPSSGSVGPKVRPSDGLTGEPIQVGAPPAGLPRKQFLTGSPPGHSVKTAD